MEAIILAGGFGTRLRHVVSDVPKPMAPVAGRPFLEILLTNLAQKGFQRVILSIGFMAEKISGHFGKNYAGMELAYAVENEPLGTGGAIRLALTACSFDHAFVFNGDTYLDLEIEQVEQRWKQGGHLIVVGKQIEDTSRYGRLIVKDRQITAFAEKGSAGCGLINAGCYVLATNTLNQFTLYESFSFEADYLALEVKRSMIEVFVTNGAFIDIGVPTDYSLAQTMLAYV